MQSLPIAVDFLRSASASADQSLTSLGRVPLNMVVFLLASLEHTQTKSGFVKKDTANCTLNGARKGLASFHSSGCSPLHMSSECWLITSLRKESGLHNTTWLSAASQTSLASKRHSKLVGQLDQLGEVQTWVIWNKDSFCFSIWLNLWEHLQVWALLGQPF